MHRITAQAAKAAALRHDGRNRYGLAEWAGASGDLGTLLPFALAYIAVVKVAPLGMLLALDRKSTRLNSSHH